MLVAHWTGGNPSVPVEVDVLITIEIIILLVGLVEVGVGR